METSASYPDDPRMRGFQTRAAIEEVFWALDEHARPIGTEVIPISKALGRILATEIIAPRSIPDFDRAAMDGYAVRGEQTFGYDSDNPATFTIIGRSRPGRSCDLFVEGSQAVEIATGAPMPRGADAVVKVESTRPMSQTVEVFEPTPPGRPVGRRGEDVAFGSPVLEPLRQIRPQDLGLLSALGITEVQVYRRPRVAIIVTGEEVLPAGSVAIGTQIVDSNSPMLEALVTRDGGLPTIIGPLADDRQRLKSVILDASRTSDIVIVSGGSSTGPEDHAPSLVAELGKLAVHGLAIRPASPSGIGFIDGVPILLFPGNPVSCLCAYDLFGSEIVRSRGAITGGWPYPGIDLPLARKIVSPIGRTDYVRVIINLPDDQILADPIATSGASILSSTTRADGFVIVPADLEGYPIGKVVRVWLYDRTFELGPS